MSQYPPSQMPPPGQPPYPPPGYAGPGTVGPRTTNGAAIASLILGILGCIPWITGFLAVILGIVGIKKSNDPRIQSGKALSIVGIILGLISIVAWTAFGGSIFALFHATQGERNYAAAFVKTVASGNAAAVKAKCAPNITSDEIDTLIKESKPWGAVSDVTTPIAIKNTQNGKTQAFASGIATFGQTKHQFMMTMEKAAGANDDAYRVTGFMYPELTAAKVGQTPTKPAGSTD